LLKQLKSNKKRYEHELAVFHFHQHRGILPQGPATLTGLSWFSSVSPQTNIDILH